MTNFKSAFALPMITLKGVVGNLPEPFNNNNVVVDDCRCRCLCCPCCTRGCDSLPTIPTILQQNRRNDAIDGSTIQNFDKGPLLQGRSSPYQNKAGAANHAIMGTFRGAHVGSSQSQNNLGAPKEDRRNHAINGRTIQNRPGSNHAYNVQKNSYSLSNEVPIKFKM